MQKILSIFLFALAVLVPGAAHGADSDWKMLSSGISKDLSSITCPEPRICYMASGLYSIGGTGSIIKTEDGGDTFKELQIPSSSPLHGISCASTQVCYAAGDFGTILKTADGGATWTEIVLGNKSEPPHFTNVFAIDAERVIVIGKDGHIFRTADGGAHWVPPSFRNFSDFYGIYFSDTSNGYIVGSGGTLLKTSDSGESWQSRGSLRAAGSLLAIRGAKGVLIAVGDGLYRSTDNGGTWTQQVAELSKNYRSAALSAEKEAYVIFDSASVAKTTDGGSKWEPHLASGAYLRDIVCPVSGYCIVVGGYGKAFRLGTVPPPPPPPAPAPVVVVPEPVVAPVTPVVVTPSPAPVTVAPVVTPEPKKASAVTAALTRTLKKGSSGEDVKQLQKILAGVAVIYPEGEITGYFGPATAKAVGRFQEKYAIAAAGASGYGEAGPKTRAKLMEAFQGSASTDVGASPVSQTTPAVITRTLKRGSRGADVTRLQEFLAQDKDVYPEGEITGYFGPATERAVGRFQEKKGIASPGQSGYGEVGPKTRAKVKELSQ